MPRLCIRGVDLFDHMHEDEYLLSIHPSHQDVRAIYHRLREGMQSAQDQS